MTQSLPDPRRPSAPAGDDVAPGLPAIDGGDQEAGLETAIDLDVRDDEASALDDASASELEGANEGWIDEAPPSASAADEDVAAPLDADPTLATGENERWTEGSDADESMPWQEAPAHEPTESSVDRGEEGFDDLDAPASDALPGLPPAVSGDADDVEADELDVNEAGALETGHAESGRELALPYAEAEVIWRGPAREPTRSVATSDDGVVVAGRSVWLFDPSRARDGWHAFPLGTEGEPSAVLVADGALWMASDAGDVWTSAHGAPPAAFARPGGDASSVGGLDLAVAAGALVARTRGGALFRRAEAAWVGPIVAKNVRRVRSALGPSGWLAAVVGSASAPELLTSRDAHTFERVKAPDGVAAVELARDGDVLALATADGALFVSRDAAASWARVPDGLDADRVWVLPDGEVLVATFHEATDHGRLLRVRRSGRVEILLDVSDETARHRLAGPGEQDGDGRVHAVAIGLGAIWVATGVGAFSIELRE